MKTWNYIATVLVISTGWFWMSNCDVAAIYQTLGCLSFVASLFLFGTTEWFMKICIYIIKASKEIE